MVEDHDIRRGMISQHPIAAYMVLAYGVSWLLWAPLWLPAFGIFDLPMLPFQHALGALGPITAAFVVAGSERGRAGIVDLVRRMGAWRGCLRWVVVGLLGPFALFVLAAMVSWIVGGDGFSLAGLGNSSEFPQFSALGFLAYNVFSFGYGEEVGWRGFALPRLQSHHSALGATIMLTVGWAVWHTPLFLYRPGYTTMGLAGVIGWFFSLLTGAVLLTWLYNESRGSILVVALFHATIDVVFTSEGSSTLVVNAAGALLTVCGILVLLATGPGYLSRSGKVVRSDRSDSVTGFKYRDEGTVTSAA